jgi:hypothetical protein
MPLPRVLPLALLSLLVTTACGGSRPQEGPEGPDSRVLGVPTTVTATAGNAQATLTWQVPASTGGSPLTGYTVVTSPGGARLDVGASSLSATVTGLTNGTPYTFQVFASNASWDDFTFSSRQ